MTRIERVCLLAIPAIAAMSLFAQTNTGVIRGLVTDPTGISVPGARAVATNSQTGVAYTAVSNDSGLYSLVDVPAGQYTLTLEKSGFRRYVRQQLTLTTGQVIALDVTFELGEVSQSVTITGEASQVQTTTSGVDQLIESKSIADLPLGDRRTMNVIQLNGAAVFTGYDSGQKPNFILSGGRAQAQMFWIDGGSGQNMRLGIGQMDTDPPVELIAEIKVLSNNYSAEYGASNGGVIIETTKSGTNDFHGSAYEYVRNDKMDAPGFFAPIQNGSKIKPKLRYNVFGGTIGGPIRRNKTFFFFDYEGGRRRTGVSQNFTVPTPGQRAGDFSQTLTAKSQLIPIYDPASTTTDATGQFVRTQFPGNIIPTARLDPVALKAVAYYPLPNRTPDNPSGANNFRGNGVNTVLHDFYSIKGDHTLTSKDRLTGRYMYNRDNTGVHSVYPDPGPDSNVFNIAHQKSGLGDWVRTISPTTVNDFRVNIATRVAHAETAGLGGNYPEKMGLQGVSNNAFPQFSPAGFTSMGSASQERRQYPIDQQQFVENISTIRGTHSLKAGFELRRSRNYEVNLPTASGSFTFSTQPTGQPGNSATGSGMAAMLLGFPTAFTEQQTQVLDRHSFYLAAFLQDDWTVSRNLTLNLGMRWETDTPMIDVNNRENSFDQKANNPVSGTPGVVKFMGVNGFRTSPYDWDWNNFGPRVGFAWKVLGTEKTVIRGGLGIFFAHPFDAGVPNGIALGFSQSISLNSPDNGITAPFYLRNGVSAAATSPVLNDAFGSVAVGQNPNTAVTFFETNRRAGYSQQMNFGVQHQLTGSTVIEASVIGNLSRKLPTSNLSIDQILPSVLGAAHQSQRDRPFPQFSNVSVQLPSLGVSSYWAGMLRAEKRYSHGLNLSASYTWSKFLENTNDPGTTAGADSGPYSDYYNRRRDYGPSANDIRQRFSFSSVYELPFGAGKKWATSGPLSKVVGGWGLGNVTVVQTGGPFTVVTQTDSTHAFPSGTQHADVSRDPNLPSDKRSVAQWFDTSAFAQPALFQFGNAGRNIVRAPGLFNMDFSVMRNFRITEHKQIQFRGEFFNALNHTNFSVPGRIFGASDFGIVSAAGPARQIQVGVRIAF